MKTRGQKRKYEEEKEQERTVVLQVLNHVRDVCQLIHEYAAPFIPQRILDSRHVFKVHDNYERPFMVHIDESQQLFRIFKRYRCVYYNWPAPLLARSSSLAQSPSSARSPLPTRSPSSSRSASSS